MKKSKASPVNIMQPFGYDESFDDVHRAIGKKKELKGWLKDQKDCFIESKEPKVGRSGRKMGNADAVRPRNNEDQVKESG